MSNNNSYYYKYLKYKKKYLELLEGGKHHGHHRHRHSHRHHKNIQPNSLSLNNMPVIFGPTQSLYPIPIMSPSSPLLVSSPRLIQSPRLIPTPLLIQSPRLIQRPIISGTQLFSNIDNYNEFDSAFDFSNKKFDKNTFVKIFNSIYTIGSKIYKGKNIINIQREKDLLVAYFISENVWTMNINNTFEILMNKLQYKLFYTPNQIIDLQDKIKKYIVLDELSHIII